MYKTSLTLNLKVVFLETKKCHFESASHPLCPLAPLLRRRPNRASVGCSRSPAGKQHQDIRHDEAGRAHHARRLPSSGFLLPRVWRSRRGATAVGAVGSAALATGCLITSATSLRLARLFSSRSRRSRSRRHWRVGDTRACRQQLAEAARACHCVRCVSSTVGLSGTAEV